MNSDVIVIPLRWVMLCWKLAIIPLVILSVWGISTHIDKWESERPRVWPLICYILTAIWIVFWAIKGIKVLFF